jgi:hypothetical protein
MIKGQVKLLWSVKGECDGIKYENTHKAYNDTNAIFNALISKDAANLPVDKMKWSATLAI